jgi:indolepyruvate decarboxylase
MNNHGYGTERPLMEGKFNDIQNWRYSKLPEVLGGGRGFYTDTEEAFDAALRQSIDLRGEYALIEVELGKTDFSFAMQRFCKLVKDRV